MAKETKTFNMSRFLAQVTTADHVRTYKRNQVIFHARSEADSVFYLRYGTVKISHHTTDRGKEAVIGFIEPGQFFGQSSLAGHAIRNSTASALDSEASVIIIKRHIFQTLLSNDREFASAFMRDLLERNERIEADLVDQLFNTSEKRLARTLLTLAHYGNHRPPQPIPGHISQTTLAKKVGTTRERVSFFMNKFRRLGFIEYDGEIVVRPALLNVALAGDDDGNGNGK